MPFPSRFPFASVPPSAPFQTQSLALQCHGSFNTVFLAFLLGSLPTLLSPPNWSHLIPCLPLSPMGHPQILSHQACFFPEQQTCRNSPFGWPLPPLPAHSPVVTDLVDSPHCYPRVSNNSPSNMAFGIVFWYIVYKLDTFLSISSEILYKVNVFLTVDVIGYIWHNFKSWIIFVFLQ